MSKAGHRSRFKAAPSPDGTIHCEALGLRCITALKATPSLVRLAGKTVVAERIVAAYEPDRATRLTALPEGSRYLGDVCRRFYPATRAGRPCELFIHLPVYELPAAPGGEAAVKALIPEGFDPETRVHAGLVAELERDLFHHSVLDCRRRTLAPRKAIEVIAARQPEQNWQAMARDRFEVLYLAIDGVNLNEQKGTNRPALQVVACNPARGIRCAIALIEMRDGHRKKVIARLARVLLRLPCPAALIALATDGGNAERVIVAEALRMAQRRCPVLAPRLVPDRYHLQDLFAEAMNDFRIETWQGLERNKDGKKRKNRSQDVKDRVWHIKQGAKALKTRWAVLQQDPEAMARLKRACAAAPVLKEAYWLLEEARRVLDARSVVEAEARHKAWQAKYAASKLGCYDTPARTLLRAWAVVRVYFEVLEVFDARYPGRNLKIGTNPAEGHNRDAKAVGRYARRSSIKRIEQRLLTRKGYIAQAQAAQPPSKPRRKRKEGRPSR